MDEHLKIHAVCRSLRKVVKYRKTSKKADGVNNRSMQMKTKFRTMKNTRTPAGNSVIRPQSATG